MRPSISGSLLPPPSSLEGVEEFPRPRNGTWKSNEARDTVSRYVSVCVSCLASMTPGLLFCSVVIQFGID